MYYLKNKIRNRLDNLSAKHSHLNKNCQSKTMDAVRLDHLLNGLRKLKINICDTSYVDSKLGLFIGNYPIKKVCNRELEEIIFLLFTGELPSHEEYIELRDELLKRSNILPVPKSLPLINKLKISPISQLSAIIGFYDHQSIYRNKISKASNWERTLEDSLNLIAVLPKLFNLFLNGKNKTELVPNSLLDSYAIACGIEKAEQINLLKLFLSVYIDHGGTNAGALVSQIVNSTSTSVFASISAGCGAISGNDHGNACYGSYMHVKKLIKLYKSGADEQDIKNYLLKLFRNGERIPGFGHAVLEIPDPRNELFLEFLKNNLASGLFDYISLILELVPQTYLEYKGRNAKPIYPNIEFLSGFCLSVYKIVPPKYFTILFAVSRSIGLCAQAVINQGLTKPLIRPVSITTNELEKLCVDIDKKLK